METVLSKQVNNVMMVIRQMETAVVMDVSSNNVETVLSKQVNNAMTATIEMEMGVQIFAESNLSPRDQTR